MLRNITWGEITLLSTYFFEIFFCGSINSPNPPDHLPMLEASEIVVKVFQTYFQMLKICNF